MKKFRFVIAAAIIVIFGLLIPVCSESRYNRTDLKIATWNMKWFPAGVPQKQPQKDEYRRMSSAGRFIGWQNPDILLAQEIRDKNVCEKLAILVRNPEFKLAACSDFDTPAEARIPTHQLAIFSKYPVVADGWDYWKPRNGIQPPRGYIYAVIDCGGSLVAFFAVHLKSNFIPADDKDQETAAVRNRKMREESARQIVAKADEISKKTYGGRTVDTIVIAGDFNTSVFDPVFKDEKTIRILSDAGYKDAFKNVAETERETMPPTKYHGAAVFDYIMIRGTHNVTNPVVAPRQWTSDHRMVTVRMNAFLKKH